MKIRLRLTLWYLVLTATIVLGFGLGTYWAMKGLLFRTLDAEMEMLSDAIERSYDPSTNKFTDLDFPPDEVNPYLEFYLIVYSTAGEPIFVSPMAERLPKRFPLPAQSVRVSFSDVVRLDQKVPFLDPGKHGKVTFRFYLRQLFHNGRPIGWIASGLHIEHVESSLAALFKTLLIAILLAILVFGLGSYFLTRQVLAPVQKMTQKARRISHSNLDERIKIPHAEDELGQLANVLNNLLERLQKAFESQKVFLADAAHELKTPLSILRSHWESEINNPELSLEMKELVVQDIETITRMNHLINNLLFLAQTEAIHANFAFSPMRLDVLFREVIGDMRVLAETKSQKIHASGMPEAMIRGDKSRLYQLFFNMLDNAVKYTPENGEIWASLQREKNCWMVEIRDNGVGIPEKDLAHIFERFYRIKKDRSRKTGGSGLGLSICSLIVNMHKGSITVESTEGSGSIFRVKIPVEPAAEK